MTFVMIQIKKYHFMFMIITLHIGQVSL